MHTRRKMHTSVPVFSRLLIPQLSQRRGIHTQAQRYTHAKRTHAKCTQAFRFTPAFWFHDFRGAEVYTRNTHTREMHTSVPGYSRLQLPRRRGIHTQNVHKRSCLLPPSDSTTFAAQRYTHAKRTHAKWTLKRSGLLPPSDSTTFAAQRYTHAKCTQAFRFTPACLISATFAAQRYTHAKRTHAKCTQAFRFTPAFWFHNFRGAEVYTRKTHTRTKCTQAFRFTPACWVHNIRCAEVYTRKTHTHKMHTSVPVYSRLLSPQLSRRRGIHTQNAHTQNAHKRSGLLPPSDSTTFAAQRYTHAKRTHAKCTQAFRFTPAFWFHNFRSAEVYTRKMHTSVPVYSRPLIPQLFVAQWHWKRDWNPTSGGCWEFAILFILVAILPGRNITKIICLFICVFNLCIMFLFYHVIV